MKNKNTKKKHDHSTITTWWDVQIPSHNKSILPNVDQLNSYG